MKQNNRINRFPWRYLFVFIAVILVISAASVLYWISAALGPTATAMDALQTDGSVRVTQERGWIVFEPAGRTASTGFIFYPGAGVDHRSYAPVLRQIAGQGYFTILLSAPLYLAFFDADAANRAIELYPEIRTWVVGGHSLGGVVASGIAEKVASVSGLVLWGSYPANGNLKDEDIEVLSLYGSLDGLSTPEDIARSRSLLPADARFIEITGGNHSQFGSYGQQPGDGVATIPPEKQWKQIIDATVELLQAVSK